jgi:hypothetical protein
MEVIAELHSKLQCVSEELDTITSKVSMQNEEVYKEISFLFF